MIDCDIIGGMDYGELFKGKKVLITGGAGFIGSALARAFVSLGARVTILDALLPLYGGNLFNLKSIADQVEFVEGDIRDKDLVEKIVAGQDFIFNLAAQVSLPDSQLDPFLDLDINCRGHLNVLEAARIIAPTAKIFFPSSRMVYGQPKCLPVTEDHSTEPMVMYGVHKLTGEKYYQLYHKIFGLHTVIVRLPNPYGPGQQMKHNKYSALGWFVRLALEDKEITVFGDGKQERDYIYIDDVTEAWLALAASGKAGEIYNLGNPEKVSVVEAIDQILLESKTGTKRHIDWPADHLQRETGGYVADTSKIERDAGWRVKTDFKSGIRKMVAYYKENRDFYWQ